MSRPAYRGPVKPTDLETIITNAGMAPSVHNTQPWSFVASDNAIEIRADRQRGLAVLDPRGRQLTISCGAALEFAYLTVRGLGRDATVRSFPHAGDGNLLAVVEIGDTRPVAADEHALVEAIPRRFTDRGAYTAAPLGYELIKALDHGIGHRGAWLRVLDHEGDRLAVIRAVTESEAADNEEPGYKAELADWLRMGPGPDGVPLAALADIADLETVSDVPLRDFTGVNPARRPGGPGEPPAVERDPLLMIGTDGDEAASWLQAGRALGWLLLRLTVEGVSTQPLGLDVERARIVLAQQLGLIGHVQFLMRTGVGHRQPTTGRRHLAADDHRP